MKKLVTILLLAGFLFNLTGCKKDEVSQEEYDKAVSENESLRRQLIEPNKAVNNSPVVGLEETPVKNFEYTYNIETSGVEITNYKGTLIKVYIPQQIEGEPVTSLGNNVFEKKNIMYAYIPDSVTNTGRYTFWDCTTLISATLSKNLTALSHGMFWGCSNLREVAIPDGVTEIASGVFYSCKSLTTITIPDSVTTIGSSVFTNCVSLSEIKIPDGVTSIGESVFEGCENLTNVTYKGDSYSYANINELYTAINGSTSINGDG